MTHRLTALLLLMPLAAARLAAQPAASTPPPLDPAAVRTMDAYARCAATNDPERAAGIVGADYRTAAYQQAIRTFAQQQNGCVPRGGKLAFQPLLFAGDLAEALMRRRRVDLSAADLHAATPNPDGPMACAVRAQPAAVARMLATKPATADEADALAALQPALAGCLAMQERVVTNRVGLRAMLALASYRLTAAAPAR